MEESLRNPGFGCRAPLKGSKGNPRFPFKGTIGYRGFRVLGFRVLGFRALGFRV